MDARRYTRLLQRPGIVAHLTLTVVALAAACSGFARIALAFDSAESGHGSLPATVPVPRDYGPLHSLDAYLRARDAWKSGETAEALAAYEEAGKADRGALAPRVAYGLALVFRDPSGALDAWRDAGRSLWEDYRSERWAARNAIMLIALAGCFGSLALCFGLILRHIRMVHHTLSETLSWSLDAGRASPAMAWILLAIPSLAGAGLLATALFHLFLCSHRLRGGERILALWAAVWAILLGPALTACAPLWSRNPSGLDGALVAEIQLDPAGRQNLAAIQTWRSKEPDHAVPMYLAGLSFLRQGDAASAVDLLTRCRGAGEIPPVILETNLASAWASLRRDDLAIQHYQRAVSSDGECFEAHYNLSILLARNGRYLEADRALDAASRVNLDRLRALGRFADATREGELLAAHLSPGHLWTLDLRSPARPDPPVILAALFPLRSLHWGGVQALLAVLLGLWTSRWIRRLLHVRVCYQCGKPVCRRCLRRLDRRAYCSTCAETMGGLGAGESTRILIRRLLDERPALRTQASTLLTFVLPGAGAVMRGNPAHGAIASFLAGLAAALWLFPLWSTPCSPVAGPGLWHDLARYAGLTALALSYIVTVASTRSSPQRRGSLRAFLNRDVDRMAA